MKKNHFRLYLAIIVAFAFCAGFYPPTAHAKVYSEDESAADEKDSDNADDDADKNADNESDMDEEDSSESPKPSHNPPPPIAAKPVAIPAPAAASPPLPVQPIVAAPVQAAPAPQSPAVPLAAPIETPPPAKDGSWWHPHPGTKWQIQYSGHIDTSLKVAAYDLDLVDTDPAVIQQLHGRGIKVICYFSAGSYEGWRPDAKQFPASIMGKNNGWKDEKWLDIRRIDILKPIMQARIAMAVQKGCDAVDPDNVEGFDNNSGFPLKSKDQLAYNKMIAELAHTAGLAVSLKNDLTQVEELLPYFDFQVNEQCFEYKSCEDVMPFIRANKPVLNIEYKESTGQFCPEANKRNFDSVKKDLDLDAKVEFCR